MRYTEELLGELSDIARIVGLDRNYPLQGGVRLDPGKMVVATMRGTGFPLNTGENGAMSTNDPYPPAPGSGIPYYTPPQPQPQPRPDPAGTPNIDGLFTHGRSGVQPDPSIPPQYVPVPPASQGVYPPPPGVNYFQPQAQVPDVDYQGQPTPAPVPSPDPSQVPVSPSVAPTLRSTFGWKTVKGRDRLRYLAAVPWALIPAAFGSMILGSKSFWILLIVLYIGVLTVPRKMESRNYRFVLGYIVFSVLAVLLLGGVLLGNRGW